MKKFIFIYFLIISLNLFAFLVVWHIFDVVFSADWFYKIVFLILSVFSLIIISIFYIRTTLKNLTKLTKDKEDV